MNLNEIINQLEIKEDYVFYNDIEEYVCIKKPNILVELPDVNNIIVESKLPLKLYNENEINNNENDNNENENDNNDNNNNNNNNENDNNYLKIFSLNDIKSYFVELIDIDNDLRITVTNDINLSLNYNTISYSCDYCKDIIIKNWFYCFHCHKDMCNLCYSEVNEEIAIKNGAHYYKEREKQLNLCRSNNLLIPRDIYMSIKKYCDICKKNLKYNQYIYNKYIDYQTPYDICEDCHSNKEFVKEIIKNDAELKLYNYKYIFDYSNLNSLLYWIPIIKDTNNNMILINLNPEDINYKKICLVSCDNHGRSGYYLLNKLDDFDNFENINMTIEAILLELNNLIEQNKYNSDDDIDVNSNNHYKFPIHYLMRKYNMQIYYG
jgi:hypothetical protein